MMSIDNLSTDLIEIVLSNLNILELSTTEISFPRVRRAFIMDPVFLAALYEKSFGGLSFAGSKRKRGLSWPNGCKQLKLCMAKLKRETADDLPFVGAMTDGGMDSDSDSPDLTTRARFSFTNCFQSTIWTPFCSQDPPPVDHF